MRTILGIVFFVVVGWFGRDLITMFHYSYNPTSHTVTVTATPSPAPSAVPATK